MDRAMPFAALVFLLAACGDAGSVSKTAVVEAAPAAVVQAATSPAQPDIYTYRVVGEFPHGTSDFTQGLFVEDGVLYETTGRFGQSAVIRHDILGETEAARRPLPDEVFGEGATAIGDRIISVTWRNGIGYVHNLGTLERVSEFPVAGEGWGLTDDGEKLILSDGTNRLRFLDPDTFEEIGGISVTANGKPVPRLNELEYIDGEIWANVWMTEVIVRIDPETGQTTGFVDLSGLYRDDRDPRDHVLNGIAWDEEADRLFVTGKNWPKIYEIEVVPTE